jgi:maltooligosyltrehalose synthase
MIEPALDTIELSAVLAALREQEANGHTAETDAERDLYYFHRELLERARTTDVILRGDRRDLDVGYRRAAKVAAFAIAAMRRIKHEQQRGAPIT